MIKWEKIFVANQAIQIIPDGSVDIIWKRQSARAPEIFLTPLMTSPQHLKVKKGDHYVGYRLAPGSNLDTKFFKSLDVENGPESIGSVLESFVSIKKSVAESIACLSNTKSCKEAAKLLGLSDRTLQRTVLLHTGQKPIFWRRLARARKACKLILNGSVLLETAHALEFSDQSHMTREMQRWFNLTPSEIADIDSDHWIWQIFENGYEFP